MTWRTAPHRWSSWGSNQVGADSARSLAHHSAVSLEAPPSPPCSSGALTGWARAVAGSLAASGASGLSCSCSRWRQSASCPAPEVEQAPAFAEQPQSSALVSCRARPSGLSGWRSLAAASRHLWTLCRLKALQWSSTGIAVTADGSLRGTLAGSSAESGPGWSPLQGSSGLEWPSQSRRQLLQAEATAARPSQLGTALPQPGVSQAAIGPASPCFQQVAKCAVAASQAASDGDLSETLAIGPAKLPGCLVDKHLARLRQSSSFWPTVAPPSLDSSLLQPLPTRHISYQPS